MEAEAEEVPDLTVQDHPKRMARDWARRLSLGGAEGVIRMRHKGHPEQGILQRRSPVVVVVVQDPEAPTNMQGATGPLGR